MAERERDLLEAPVVLGLLKPQHQEEKEWSVVHWHMCFFSLRVFLIL